MSSSFSSAPPPLTTATNNGSHHRVVPPGSPIGLSVGVIALLLCPVILLALVVGFCRIRNARRQPSLTPASDQLPTTRPSAEDTQKLLAIADLSLFRAWASPRSDTTTPPRAACGGNGGVTGALPREDLPLYTLPPPPPPVYTPPSSTLPQYTRAGI